MNICLVGGHLTPALALGDLAQKKGHTLSFIGRVSTSKNLEASASKTRGWTYAALRAPKAINLRLIPDIYRSYSKAQKLLRQLDPDIVVSFGSFLSVPLVVAAKRLHIPVIIHEQTAVAGLANRLLAPLANRIAVSFPQSLSFFPKGKTVVTGNPLRAEFYKSHLPRPKWLPPSNAPLLYITGGSQGSEAINEVVSKLFPKITSYFQVIHQCGGSDSQRRQELSRIYEHSNLYLRSFLDAKEAAWCLRYAVLVIGRSGANTVCEIMISGVPSILIPLPHARFQEQTHNASLISDQGAGLLLPQLALSPDKLLSAINQITHNLPAFKDKAQSLKTAVPLDAAQKLLDLCLSL